MDRARASLHDACAPITMRATDTYGLSFSSHTTLAQLPATAIELPRDREVVLYCNCPNEVSALRGVRILADLGHHRARALHGGLDAWLEVEALSPLGQLPAGLDPAQSPMSAMALGSDSMR